MLYTLLVLFLDIFTNTYNIDDNEDIFESEFSH